jgi:4-diphosphocytidyl-2-C-methyl-D-erythritol kinase
MNEEQGEAARRNAANRAAKGETTTSMLGLDARAKVNLFLEVIRRRTDGYHDLVSVFQEIDLADRLQVEPEDDGEIRLECTDPALPTDGRNLVVRAAERLRDEAGIRSGARFRLEKRIPCGAGLGGGSSDAAAALRLACRLWDLAEDRGVLAGIARQVGSDVPFFLWGGTCLCEGRGERVTPLPEAPGLPLVLVLPPWGISTASAYQALAGRRLGSRDAGPFLKALAADDREGMARESFNRFEEAVFELEPRQRRLHEALTGGGARAARLSGSGSAEWSLETTGAMETALREAAARLGVERVAAVQGHGGG